MDAREFKGIIYNTLVDHQCKDQEDDKWVLVEPQESEENKNEID